MGLPLLLAGGAALSALTPGCPVFVPDVDSDASPRPDEDVDEGVYMAPQWIDEPSGRSSE